MLILSRTLLASYLGLFASILIGSMFAIAIVEMLINLDDIVKRPELIASHIFLRIPSQYLRDAVPMASFAAAFFCLGLPARWHEITALKAGGISPQRVVVPLLTAAAVLSGAALLVNETLLLEASRKWNRLENAGGRIVFRRGTFWYHRGDTIYNVAEVDRKTRTLRGVRVFRLDPRGRLQQSIRADFARIADDQSWHLKDATTRTFDNSDPAASPRVDRSETTVLHVAGQGDLERLDASAGTLSILDLVEYIRERSREGRSAPRFHAMLHSRLAEPLTVLVFALLAIPLGLAVEQTGSLAVSSLLGIAILGGYYAVRTGTALLAAGGFPMAATSPWLVLTGFGGLGVWLFARVPR